MCVLMYVVCMFFNLLCIYFSEIKSLEFALGFGGYLSFSFFF